MSGAKTLSVDASPVMAEATLPAIAPTFEQRWAAWQARGAAHDRAVRRRIAIVAPTVAVAALILYVLLVR